MLVAGDASAAAALTSSRERAVRLPAQLTRLDLPAGRHRGTSWRQEDRRLRDLLNKAGVSRPPEDSPPRDRRRQLAAAVLFTCTSFTGAGLLFLVQPMVAKLVLPLFGGSPSVWNTSNLFFQLSLLAGYVITHLSVRRLGVRRQSVLQVGLVLLPLLALPIGLPGQPQTPDGAAPIQGTRRA
jgi:hypothetical protein